MPRKAGNPITNKKWAVLWCVFTRSSFTSSRSSCISSVFLCPTATGSARSRHPSAPTPASGRGKGSRKAEEDETRDAVPQSIKGEAERPASGRDVEIPETGINMRTDAENIDTVFELRNSVNSGVPKEDNVNLSEDCCSTASAGHVHVDTSADLGAGCKTTYTDKYLDSTCLFISYLILYSSLYYFKWLFFFCNLIYGM